MQRAMAVAPPLRNGQKKPRQKRRGFLQIRGLMLGGRHRAVGSAIGSGIARWRHVRVRRGIRRHARAHTNTAGVEAIQDLRIERSDHRQPLLALVSPQRVLGSRSDQPIDVATIKPLLVKLLLDLFDVIARNTWPVGVRLGSAGHSAELLDWRAPLIDGLLPPIADGFVSCIVEPTCGVAGCIVPVEGDWVADGAAAAGFPAAFVSALWRKSG
jgi:hypothetical protein